MPVFQLVGTWFGRVDINIECKNILISSDIRSGRGEGGGGVIFSMKKSEARIPKKFCSSISPTTNEK